MIDREIFKRRGTSLTLGENSMIGGEDRGALLFSENKGDRILKRKSFTSNMFWIDWHFSLLVSLYSI